MPDGKGNIPLPDGVLLIHVWAFIREKSTDKATLQKQLHPFWNVGPDFQISQLKFSPVQSSLTFAEQLRPSGPPQPRSIFSILPQY